MQVAVSGKQRDARPPVATHAAPNPDTATRRSARRRPTVTPSIWDDGTVGVPPDAAYVRRFWTALIGSTAVAELLRLVTAARKNTSLPCPIRLPQLAAEGLVSLEPGRIHVRATIPPLGPGQTRRLSPALRAEHCKALTLLFPDPSNRSRDGSQE
ncbi:MAG: hypothetical protein GXP34_00805 [Actinobacteria bacterium]|nr:hypothetical protein [Actinomycetota bacterium]